VEWIHLAQDRIQLWVSVNVIMNLQVPSKQGIFDHLNNDFQQKPHAIGISYALCFNTVSTAEEFEIYCVLLCYIWQMVSAIFQDF
jgi:hypothetical protein